MKFLLFLAIAGNATTLLAQAPVVQVQVYTQTDMKPGSLHGVMAVMQEILMDAGLPVQVKICRANHAEPCGTGTGNVRGLVIRVVARAPKIKQSMLEPLGESFADHEGGTYASVFLEQVKDAAEAANVPWDVVLAYAVAHEVGHLLLGAEAHTARGLMKATWGQKEYDAMNHHQLLFTKEQAHQLAARYGRSTSGGRGVELASVGLIR